MPTRSEKVVLQPKGPEVPESQKSALAEGIDKQKARLRDTGFGESLDKFFNTIDQASFLLRNSANVGRVSIDVARSTVNRIIAANKKNWNVDISAVATFDDLPDNVKDGIAKTYGEDARKNAKGVVHKGKVYVIAGKNENETDTEQTILHEIERHIGIHKLYGKEITQKLNKLYIL